MIQRQRKIRPKFHQIPDWLAAYKGHGLNANTPQFHYYSAQDQTSRAVTLYIPDNDIYRPLTMYYNIQPLTQSLLLTQPDQSPLKDFSYLKQAQQHQHQKITLSRQQIVHDSSWVKKYQPTKFFQLLTDEMINRNILTWMTSWDEIVFNKKIKKLDDLHGFFKKGIANKPWYLTQEYNYKKLILLAGPPGCGKTTLARVIARHCGYHCEEINASDDRSGRALITKIDNLVTNRTVGRVQKPVCVVIDEVDGALDSDSNGIKDVIQYIETGIIPGGKTKKVQKGQKMQKKSKIGFKHPDNKPQKVQQQRKTKIDRPIIFICNDPFVRGLKELRGRAMVVYFGQLQEDRVVRRLKQITDNQDIYIESDTLAKVCQMCNNDVRSSVGVLEMLVKFKKQQGIQPRQSLARLNLSISKDAVTSTNQFLQKLNSSKSNTQNMFNNLHYSLAQHGNPSLLFQTFFHNIFHHKNIFLRNQSATKFYQQIVNYDVRMRQNHGQIDQFSMMPYCYFRNTFRPDDIKKIEFPSIYFQKLNKHKTNQALLEKIMKQIPSYLRVFNTPRNLVQDIFYLFWLTMQSSSTKEDDIIRCVYKLLTYGFKLAHRGAPHLFNPQFDQFLTFGITKPEILLSSTTRNLIEQNYEFLKMKNQLVVQSLGGDRQNYEAVINQLKRNRRRNRQLQGGALKYKYLEGTGTQIKYDLKIGNFFEANNRL